MRREIFRKAVDLGFGSTLGRVFSVSVVIWLGRGYGVVTLGIYGLAMGASMYLMPIIDFGLRHAGARLIARFPDSSELIRYHIQYRRLRMAIAAIVLLFAYSTIVNVPLESRIFVFTFASVTVLYAFSLDWAAWGQGKMLMIGLGSAFVPGCMLVALLYAHYQGHVFSALIAGHLAGYIVLVVCFRQSFRRDLPRTPSVVQPPTDIGEMLRFSNTGIVGLAILSNLAFNTIDMLMLGVLSDPTQVGLYSAAYRILNQTLLTYYLLTNAMFPYFARHSPEQRRNAIRPLVLLKLALAGAALSLLLILFRRPIVEVVFGNSFSDASRFVLILACSIPLDFVSSYLATAYIAWGFEHSVLICTGLAAAGNVLLNLLTMKRYGAIAASFNTAIAYVLLVILLLSLGRTIRMQGEPSAIQ